MSDISDPIFARIAARYDLINRILSLGQEKKWRAAGIDMLEPGTVLDLGCGTGATDFKGRVVVGLDPVIEMLALSPVPDRVVGAGESLPLREGSLDAVFSGFVFRNLSSVDDTLAEIHRVLKPGSSAVVVDLARPRNVVLRVLHRIGTAVLLPLVGLLFAGRPRGVLVPPPLAGFPSATRNSVLGSRPHRRAGLAHGPVRLRLRGPAPQSRQVVERRTE